MHQVLIDTGAVYAFVVRTDAHHEEARVFMEDLNEREIGMVLADIVFAETMTLLKARIGAPLALRVGRHLRNNPAYRWTPLGEEGEEDTWATFQQYNDKEWSYTDCALFVLSKRLAIPNILSFDSHFEQMPDVLRVP